MKKYNILVTGCGGDIGQSIGKILQSSPLIENVIGCDLNLEHAGKFIFDRIQCVSSCRSDKYFYDIEQIVKDEQIDVIIPVSEPELRFFSEIKLGSHLFEKPLIKANQKSLEIGFDKLKTAYFLEEHGLPFPVSSSMRDLMTPVYPLVLKSRDGSGSKNLFIIKDDLDFEYYKKKYPDFIAQELVGTASDEFTCGLFRSNTGDIRHIIFRRRLVGGFSGYGTVEINSDISNLLTRIALELNLKGSINVQLRITDKGPCVFEINPRFSSTVLFRHLMGFEDVIWSIQEVLSLPLSPNILTNNHKSFYKGYQEYVD